MDLIEILMIKNVPILILRICFNGVIDLIVHDIMHFQVFIFISLEDIKHVSHSMKMSSP